MLDTRPFLYVPRSNAVARMLEAEPLARSLRARHVGVVLIRPSDDASDDETAEPDDVTDDAGGNIG